jgi:tRNA1(Val) A37 N6-methylase TrmN6
MAVVGVERDGEMAELARRNVRRNGLEGRASIIKADLTAPVSSMRPLGLVENGFDIVLANPPFYEEGSSRRSASRGAAHQMEKGGLAKWLRFLAAMARPGGELCMIHRPESLPELLAVMEGRFGAIAVKPVFSRPRESAIRILLRGVKGSRAPFSLRGGLVLRGANDEYSPEAEGILRRGASVVW